MAKTLVVVESPAKAKTIKKYLGSDYEVLASKGHVKDLPKSGKAIDIENGFTEKFEVIEGKEKVLAELKAAAKNADAILLATDPDREGEAIAFHLAEELKIKGITRRVEFHEITKAGVKRGVDNPRDLDKDLYDAQRCRRVLDRIVGYDVSSLVWKKLAFGLSAGRVQSVALRLIVDREREIEAFVPEEYWNIGAPLASKRDPRAVFQARLSSKNEKKFEVVDGVTAASVKADLTGATYTVAKITKRETKRHPAPPYTTSKLQQDAVNRLSFGAKRTMQIAQGLYEGVELGKDLGGTVGLITYMRTDSTRVAPEMVTGVRTYIHDTFGKAYVPAKANEYKSKKNAQEAHEAIRPASLDLSPETVRKYLKEEQYKLYKLIWDRFVASQMADATYDQTSVDIEAKTKTDSYGLKAGGRVLKFAGWLEALGTPKGQKEEKLAGEEEEAPASGARLMTTEEDGEMPPLEQNEALLLKSPPGVAADQKFTQPPARYNEGSLVRELEERGIGRPSTYAEIINKVQARDYVEKVDGGKAFRPTDLGKRVVDGLVGAKLDFIEPAFTSAMEEELDQVEAGKEDRVVLLKRFYKKFREQLDAGSKGDRWVPDPEATGETCDKCGTGQMMKRWSKNGYFIGCSNYGRKKDPCKNTRNLDKDGNVQVAELTEYKCHKCSKPMVKKSGRYGEFLSCTGYPECDGTRPVPLGVPCPKCGGDIIEIRSAKRGGRTFYGCSNYAVETIKCDFKLWAKPIPTPCPACNLPFLVMGGTKAKPQVQCSDTKGCGYKAPASDGDGDLAASAE
jgi:DNA topoisomerase-1